MINDKIINDLSINSPSLPSKWFFSKFFAIPFFAHHPTCKCFNHHLVRFGSYSFCLGCFSFGVGLIACIAFSLFNQIFRFMELEFLNFLTIFFIGVFLIFPTFIQPFFQEKCFKILSRASLGFGVTSLWLWAIFLLSWDELGLTQRGIFILVFIFFFKLGLKFRNHFTIKTTCICGPNAYPYCPENQLRRDKLLQHYLKMASAKNDPMMPIIQALAMAQQFNNPIILGDKVSTLTVQNK